MRAILVDNLVDQVRSQIDEDNITSVSTEGDIIPALNRAQDYAANILSRHYEAPLLKYKTVDLISGTNEYRIPEDALEQRVEKVEVKINGLYYPVKRVSYRDISMYESESGTNVPYYYTIVGDRIRILPSNNGTYDLRVWYSVNPLPMGLSQGRINSVTLASNYVILDAVGSKLTTVVDDLNSYVHVLDGQTGSRKGTFQVKNITGNRVEFKTTPMRPDVLNYQIDTDATTLLINSDPDNESGDVAIEPDDYLCIITESCVPFFQKPFSNFLIQYAVAEMRRKLGGNAELAEQVLQKLEEQVERSWVGRETDLRVTKKNQSWNMPIRRYWGIRS